MKNWGDAIKEARKSAALTQQGAVELLEGEGIQTSVSSLQGYEAGANEPRDERKKDSILSVLTQAAVEYQREKNGKAPQIFGPVQSKSVQSGDMPERPVRRTVVLAFGGEQLFRIGFTVEGIGDSVRILDLGSVSGAE